MIGPAALAGAAALAGGLCGLIAAMHAARVVEQGEARVVSPFWHGLAAALLAGGGALLAPDLMAALGLGLIAGLSAGVIESERRGMIILDAHTLLLALAGLALARGVDPSLTLYDQIAGGALGYVLLDLVRRGFRAARGLEGMGFGDVKLAGAAGLWLGPFWLGPWLSVSCALALAFALGRGLGREQAFAFGPFLVGGLFTLALYRLAA